MKRCLFAVLLAAALAVPVFASEKGKSELNLKLGIIPSPDLTAQGNDIVSAVSGVALKGNSINTHSINNGIGASGKTGFVAGLDYFYYLQNNSGVGLGLNRAFPVEYVNGNIAKIDSTNIYLTAKRKVNVESFLDAIYFVGRLGYGINNADSSIDKMLGMPSVTIDVSIDNGLYWALGIGFEKDCILLEFVYSVNYSKLNVDINAGGDKISASSDITVSAIGINVGYKFEL